MKTTLRAKIYRFAYPFFKFIFIFSAPNMLELVA
jgi:hypothetical protein